MTIHKFFKRSEFACKCGCGFDVVDAQLLSVLVDLRSHFTRPVIINSACRCAVYNKLVGGSEKSQHVLGKAADIYIPNVSTKTIYKYLCDKYKNMLGIGLYDNFIHIDVRDDKARWQQ